MRAFLILPCTLAVTLTARRAAREVATRGARAQGRRATPALKEDEPELRLHAGRAQW